jgi:phosphatidylinositol glycan class Z
MTEMTAGNSRSSLSWIIYSILVLLRVVVGPILPGYVHPDEFFQGGQELWFGCPPTIPWEFEPGNALRSVVPPTLLSWIPLQIYAWIRGLSIQSLSGTEIWIVPRVACSIFSVMAVDFSVWRMTSTSRAGVPLPVLVLASAWPTFAILNRPFSNALETFVLALLMASVVKGRAGFANHVVVGALCSLGIFTRFTFVFFAIPVMLYFLWEALGTTKTWSFVFQRILVTTLSFVVVSASIVYLDSKFYASRTPDSETIGVVLAPLNALLYNSQVANLKDHGLHPRWTHALVNMFLLYGPLALMTYLSLVTSIDCEESGKTRNSSSNSETKSSTIHVVCRWTVVVGLGFLSIAPHQEPRFLLALIVPLVLIGTHRFRSPVLLAVWVVFNAIVLLVFGVLHQSGVVPSLLATGSTLLDREPTMLIYSHTYMPPTFLSRPKREQTCGSIPDEATDESACTADKDACRDIRIVDLKGFGMATVREVLRDELLCDERTESSGRYIHLVMPTLISDLEGDSWSFTSECIVPDYDCKRIWNYSPHLTTEDLPAFAGSLSSFVQEGMSLNLYEMSCREVMINEK